MKFLLSLPLIFIPMMASAEATGGYNFDGLIAGIALAGIAIIAGIVAIIVFIVKRWKKRT